MSATLLEKVIMPIHRLDFLRHYRQLAVMASLAFASAICLAMLVVRVVYAENRTYWYLAWNLFLAWLPLLCSLFAYNPYQRRSPLSWLVVAAYALAWLSCFP